MHSVLFALIRRIVNLQWRNWRYNFNRKDRFSIEKQVMAYQINLLYHWKEDSVSRKEISKSIVWQIHGQKCESCSKSATGLLPCCHQADIRMRVHLLLRLDSNKSAASCQQPWCKLIVKFSTTSSKSANIKLLQVSFSQTQQAGKFYNL